MRQVTHCTARSSCLQSVCSRSRLRWSHMRTTAARRAARHHCTARRHEGPPARAGLAMLRRPRRSLGRHVYEPADEVSLLLEQIDRLARSTATVRIPGSTRHQSTSARSRCALARRLKSSVSSASRTSSSRQLLRCLDVHLREREASLERDATSSVLRRRRRPRASRRRRSTLRLRSRRPASSAPRRDRSRGSRADCRHSSAVELLAQRSRSVLPLRGVVRRAARPRRARSRNTPSAVAMPSVRRVSLRRTRSASRARSKSPV